MKRRCVETKVDCLDARGYGAGSWEFAEGDVRRVAVPYTLVGERVETEIFHKRKSCYVGKLKRVIDPHEERVEPRCPHFGLCGGCIWQQMPYEMQCQTKEERVKDLFLPLADERTQWLPLIKCEEPWEYRNKLELSFSNDKHHNRYLGLIERDSRGKVFEMTACYLARPWIQDLLKVVRSWWEKTGLDAYHSYRNTGALRTLTVREGMRTGEKMVMLTVSGNPDYALKADQLRLFKEKVGSFLEKQGECWSLFIRIQQAIKGRPTQFYEMHLGGNETIREKLVVGGKEMTFHISPSAFFQPNTVQAEKLYAAVLKQANLSHDKKVLDLYCGTGTLSCAAALFAKEVVGIEISPESLLDAEENVKENGVGNITFIKGDVGTVLGKQKADVVFVDPPRMGLDKKAIEGIKRLAPSTLVYISCNPTTQADNVSELLLEGYFIKTIQSVDQFPQTQHIENIVVLHAV